MSVKFFYGKIPELCLANRVYHIFDLYKRIQNSRLSPRHFFRNFHDTFFLTSCMHPEIAIFPRLETATEFWLLFHMQRIVEQIKFEPIDIYQIQKYCWWSLQNTN